jgi:multimeric flavodoxin WrbA
MLQKASDSVERNGGFIEIIHLKDQKIDWCEGCLTCEDTGICIIKDDMKSVIEKMLSSQGIIISTPVYFNSIPAKLKCFFDRLNPLLKDERLSGKKLSVFIVGQLSGKDGEKSRKDVMEYFLTLADIFNMDLIGIVDAEGRGAKDLEGNDELADKCERLGKKLVTNLR